MVQNVVLTGGILQNHAIKRWFDSEACKQGNLQTGLDASPTGAITCQLQTGYGQLLSHAIFHLK